MGILIIATAVLSSLGVGDAQLMETETQTQDVNRLTPLISETARLIRGRYFGITALAIAVVVGFVGERFDPDPDLGGLDIVPVLAFFVASIKVRSLPPTRRSSWGSKSIARSRSSGKFGMRQRYRLDAPQSFMRGGATELVTQFLVVLVYGVASSAIAAVGLLIEYHSALHLLAGEFAMAAWLAALGAGVLFFAGLMVRDKLYGACCRVRVSLRG